ncbi:MAG TPA: discoidin domain-containing protein, partial [Thermoleophilia bacterium]|nr:discoidin domain-containing protein [Thermoleophilia bacterium]
MHKKAAASGVLVVLLLAALLGASSMASAKPRALRYRIVRHTRSFDVVKGHGKRLVVRRHARYVRIHGVRRYRVVRRHRRSMLLRRLPRTGSSRSLDTPITSGSAEPAGLPATASSAQEACPASNGNDGVEATRWEAGSPDYPQWWTVDLGSVKTVTGVRTSWHSAVPD